MVIHNILWYSTNNVMEKKLLLFMIFGVENESRKKKQGSGRI